ncbi:hypothetical protein KP78_15220 [Jeotgalibacillus soli]|uniref:Uncharacterized protein n=1 Tax=Jeotgalibacillus soli TaxID=889306 RepID=A0A0C2S7T6_9BACL|nr:hypothetical protein KP78_15220 [Jeotgalibacillus soli]
MFSLKQLACGQQIHKHNENLKIVPTHSFAFRGMGRHFIFLPPYEEIGRKDPS